MHIVPSSPGLTVQNEKEKDIVKGKTRRSGDDGERSVDITVIPSILSLIFFIYSRK